MPDRGASGGGFFSPRSRELTGQPSCQEKKSSRMHKKLLFDSARVHHASQARTPAVCIVLACVPVGELQLEPQHVTG